MNPKARITYRFDKQNGTRVEQKTEETERKAKSNVVSFFQEEMKFTSEIGSWNSPFQNDAHALEQLIRDTDHQPQSSPPVNKENATKSYGPIKAISHKSVQYDEDYAEDMILLGDEKVNRKLQTDIEPQHPQKEQFQRQSYPIIDLDEVEEYEMDLQERKIKSLSSFKTAANYRSTRGPSWFKVFASVTAAIVTGALFGYFVLALFTNNPAADNTAGTQPSETTLGEAAANTGKNSDAAKSNSTTDGQGKSAAGTANNPASAADSTPKVKVQIPAASYFMLQYGVFSNKEGLDAAVNELKDKGLSAAPLTTPDDFRVYVGVSTDQSQAQLLSQTLSDMDVYVKQIDVPALNQIGFKGDAAVVETFFKQSNELIRQWDAMTQEGLSGNSAAEAGNWTEKHQEWTKTAALVETGIVNKSDKAALLKFEQNMNTAAMTASEYAKKQADAYLWSLQTALMEAIFTQKAWFVSMDAL
ncbi:SPOR domain-containing protein [Paenibacillus solisilvae]|uniref:SPOR domain-containing protein n=1 Tax=Paenibacillus solisilvae TaxID=2486751 RepID=A0ABW0VX87_9BACL